MSERAYRRAELRVQGVGDDGVCEREPATGVEDEGVGNGGLELSERLERIFAEQVAKQVGEQAKLEVAANDRSRIEFSAGVGTKPLDAAVDDLPHADGQPVASHRGRRGPAASVCVSAECRSSSTTRAGFPRAAMASRTPTTEL
jgi:hypothetical protein